MSEGYSCFLAIWTIKERKKYTSLFLFIFSQRSSFDLQTPQDDTNEDAAVKLPTQKTDQTTLLNML